MLSPEYILNILRTECSYRDGDSILVGVSGGADSVALLHLLHAADVPVAAAHVNYGLRGEESDGDEQFVSELCAELKVPLYVRKTNREELNTLSGNLQDAARGFRSRFFAEIRTKESMTWSAVAHNSDDQLETVLINFMRGSALRGITGMRYQNGRLIRPLLKISRKEIEAYLNASSIRWRDDSSNASDIYLRNRVRHQLVPVLSEIDERKGKGIERTIENLSAQRELLGKLVLPWWNKASREGSGYTAFSKSVLAEFETPHLLLNYLLDFTGATQCFTSDSYHHFISSQTGKFLEFGASKIYNDREEIVVVSESAADAYPFKIFPGADLADWSCEMVSPDHPEQYQGCEALVNAEFIGEEMMVRAWNDGDKIFPLGFSGTKKVSDVLTEMKVPSYLKENYPVVTHNDEIVWIPGYRIADKYKVTDKTKTALHIKWKR